MSNKKKSNNKPNYSFWIIVIVLLIVIAIIVAVLSSGKNSNALISTPNGGPVVDYNPEPFTDENGEVIPDFGYHYIDTITGYDVPDAKLTRRDSPIPNIWTDGSTILVSGNFTDIGKVTLNETVDNSIYQEVENKVGPINLTYSITLENADSVECLSDSALTYMIPISDDTTHYSMIFIYYVQPDGKIYECTGTVYTLEGKQYISATLPYSKYIFIKNGEEGEVN